MHIHFIQHVPFEFPGVIKDWAKDHQHATTYTKVFEAAIFPSAEKFDMLIVLGGPMGVYEAEKFVWMQSEKLFIKTAIEKNKKILGICLGAQFIAEALGAKVFPHTIKEIGWLPVEKVSAHKLTDHLPQTFTTFHWHGDTFNLPKGAVHLFKTDACLQQGFIYNNHAAAIQFHIEAKEDLLQSMIEHERAELIKSEYVQTENEIKKWIPQHISQQKKFLYDFLEAFIKL